jgi:hypothetical protein
MSRRIFYYTTSSAIFVIFLHPKSLSSLATGPNTLFPIGFIFHFASLVRRTTALSPNLTYVPSGLEISLRTLTITAGTTCHFLTEAVGVASLIATTTLSQIPAVFAVDHFTTLIIFAFFACVLSATTTNDSCFNILINTNKVKDFHTIFYHKDQNYIFSTTNHLFNLDIGFVALIFTVSQTFETLFSS